jgi:Nuclease-related domain
VKRERQPTHLGAAGASAARRSERIGEQRRLQASGRSRLGRVLAMLLEPEHEQRLVAEERNWRSGARGEQIVAATLAKRCPRVPMLHDRRAPMSRGNIDHVAVASSGIYVIDTKRYRGEIRIVKPLFGQPKLTIARRDRTKLLAGLEKQVAQVQAAISDLAADVPVIGCLCFVAPQGLLAESGLPTFRTLRINGFALYSPRRLARQLKRRGPLGTERALALHAALAMRLPPALRG